MSEAAHIYKVSFIYIDIFARALLVIQRNCLTLDKYHRKLTHYVLRVCAERICSEQ